MGCAGTKSTNERESHLQQAPQPAEHQPEHQDPTLGLTSTLDRTPKYSGGWNVLSEGSQPGPSPRHGHSATLVDEHLYIFGGQERYGEMPRDLWVWLRGTEEWESAPYSKERPMGRVGHGAVALGGQLYIMGGTRTMDSTRGMLPLQQLVD